MVGHQCALIASAHGGEVRIELNVTQAGPGATIGLRGSGFEQGDTVTIMLVGANGQFLLGTANADGDGDLTHALPLPLDLASGAYEVRVADMHHAAAAPLNIVPDSSGDEEGSQRGEDEPQLATMPLPRRAIVPLSSQTAAAPTPTANARDSLAWLLLLPVGTLVVAGTALIVKKRFARQGRTFAEHGRSLHTSGEGYPFFTPRMTTQDIMDQRLTDYITANSPVAPAIQGRSVCTTTGAAACPVVTP